MEKIQNSSAIYVTNLKLYIHLKHTTENKMTGERKHITSTEKILPCCAQILGAWSGLMLISETPNAADFSLQSSGWSSQEVI